MDHLNLQNYFSVLDHFYDDMVEVEGENCLYYFAIDSSKLKKKNVVLNPTLHPVTIYVDYAENAEFELEVKNVCTEMYVYQDEKEVATACPICYCKVADMEILEKDDYDDLGLIKYRHICGFTEESIENVLKEAQEVRMFEHLLPELTLDYRNEEQLGFNYDGSYYFIKDHLVYHYHFHREDIYCSYCSCNEPIYNDGSVAYQLCPVLTKCVDLLMPILDSLEPLDSEK